MRGHLVFARGVRRLAIAITGPRLRATGQTEAIGFLELLAPAAFLDAISAILLAVCQAEQRFVAISAAGLAGTATTLVTMLLAWDSLGLQGLAIGSLLGPIVTLVVLLGATLRASLYWLRSGQSSPDDDNVRGGRWRLSP